MNKFNTIATIIAVAALSSASIAAQAAGTDVPTLSVKYSPRSLATDQGAREVYHRLVVASELVCPVSSSATRFVSESIKECRSEALARAVRQIDNSRLAAVYANSSKNG